MGAPNRPLECRTDGSGSCQGTYFGVRDAASQFLVSRMKLLRALRRLRIPLSFGLFVSFIVMARPSLRSILIGSLISLFGIVLRTWASGCLHKDSELTTTGPYQYTRHPLYLGSLIIGLGFSVSCRSGWVLLLFLLFFILIYIPTMIAEAEHLRRLFGEAYEEYERAVPMFFPKLACGRPGGLRLTGGSSSLTDRMQEKGTPLRKDRPRGFDFSLYMQNREYRVPIGSAIVLGILLLLAYRQP